MKTFSFLILSTLLLTACGTSKEIIRNNKDQNKEYAVPDERHSSKDINNYYVLKTKTEEIKSYKESNPILHDLIHTKLDLHFDYLKEHVLGVAEITVKPHYYPADTLILDAQKFIIHSVELLNENRFTKLKYSYNNEKLLIYLDKTYNKEEKYTVKIKYTSRPGEIQGEGSWAIRSNKGLYFINARSDNPQIWTQGETQCNSAWFPTIDSPNQNMTQEIIMTVDNKYKTLSNGILVSSLANEDGTRTDHWKQDKAHAPYLAMIAVGKFEIIKDYWRDMPVFVYAEKEDIEKAKGLFKKTYKMIEFYSEKLDYDFPWDKYHQIVVKNFVSGAMENTGAVVFGDYVLGWYDEEQRIRYESVVAHELSHHWFGDLVTCESWANLPLNESFATYFEYLWLEHEYGRYTADMHLEDDYSSYSFERLFKDENLIRFYNKHRDNMFDAHSYQKGGLILHMLRYTVGDDAFWDALELYLKDNEYQPVEIHHLRLAFEEVTGQDMNWFFNQWFLSKGIPELKINYSYNETNLISEIKIEQTQNLHKFPLYKIPSFVDIYLQDTVIRKKIVIDDQKEAFQFSTKQKPLFMNFDPENSILCKKNENYSIEEYIQILDKAPLYKDKDEALKKFKNNYDPKVKKVFLKLLNHENWQLRYAVLYQFQLGKNDALYNEYLSIIKDLSENDKHHKVRNRAMEIIPK